MIKVIIFDFDGVIINEYAKHYEFTKKRIKGLTEEEFKGLFEGNFHVQLKKFKGRDRGRNDKSNYNEYLKTIIIDSKIKGCLQRLSQKYTLGIITSARESGAEISLRNSGLKGVFSFDYGFETHPNKVEKFRKVLDKYNVKPERCIFVTDTTGDILEARKIGIKSIAVDSGYHKRESLEKVNPVKIIHHLSELQDVLEKF